MGACSFNNSHTAAENELADSLGEAMRQYPNAVAVLVRRHGLYVWGNTWEAAKRHGECLHYLFDMALQMSSMGFDFMTKPTSAITAGCFDCSEDTSSSKKRAVESSTGDALFFNDDALLSIDSAIVSVIPANPTHCTHRRRIGRIQP